MKKFAKVLCLLLAVVMLIGMTACGPKTNDNQTPATQAPATQAPATQGPAAPEVTYERAEDEDVFLGVLGDYEELLNAADANVDVNMRYVLYAEAEAHLLASATFVPTTTQNGAYTISRIAPRTVPYVQWGNDDDRLKKMVISDEFLTPAERADLLDLWAKACAGEAEYDPAAYLISKGHTIQSDYTTTFSTAPVTLDWLNTSSQSDTEITVNCVDGLVEYNGLSQMTPALAESWDISDDGSVYTFHIRPGVYWYTADGAQYAEVTANDFVAGLHHMLDTQAGLEWLVDGIIVGATDYYANGGSFDDVGYKAVDKYTLEVTLEGPTPYFMTMLTYSCFLPICDSFYQAHGGVYGVDEYATASADEATYTYGKSTDPASQVYCGPFLVQKLEKDSEIYLVRNNNYYKNSETTLNSIKWVYDNGEDLPALYQSTVDGTYAGIGVSNATLNELAKKDGRFEKFAYVSETTSTTYFGGLNLNRGTFALEAGTCASPQTEEQKISTHTAMQNYNFRKAILFAFNQETYNAISRGDLALTNLRNMYCHPEFVALTADTAASDGHVFPAGTFYGEMVQYWCDKLGFNIDVRDGVNGWYHPEEAKAAIEAAAAELGDSVTWPINIDVVYYSANDIITAQAADFKTSLETNLGTDRIQVNLVEATTSADYYASGYRASNGEAGNYDMFYGSGWGPDYGDPKTYLDTFKGYGAGYMTKVIGLF